VPALRGFKKPRSQAVAKYLGKIKVSASQEMGAPRWRPASWRAQREKGHLNAAKRREGEGSESELSGERLPKVARRVVGNGINSGIPTAGGCLQKVVSSGVRVSSWIGCEEHWGVREFNDSKRIKPRGFECLKYEFLFYS
jgi:hypothetical protein